MDALLVKHYRACRSCGQIKECGTRCRPCRQKTYQRWRDSGAQARYQREWKRRNPDKQRQYHFKTRYGITLEDYDVMLKAQNGVCAICRKPETARYSLKEPRRLGVDHDHATGEVRGLLCHSCNVMLGLLKDDLPRLRRALEYLEVASSRS